jgi:hypothetical protein
LAMGIGALLGLLRAHSRFHFMENVGPSTLSMSGPYSPSQAKKMKPYESLKLDRMSWYVEARNGMNGGEPQCPSVRKRRRCS